MNNLVTLTQHDVVEFIDSYKKYIDPLWVDLDAVADHIKKSIPEKITMNEFYNYVADYCISKASTHPDYNVIASRICVDRLHNSTPDNIIDAMDILYKNTDADGKHHPLISENLFGISKKYKNILNDIIDHNKDYQYDYFGIRTLERSYLLKIYDSNKKKIIIERPQYMVMRVALGIHGDDIDSAIETYHLMSNRYFTHATPTLFNAGTNNPQLSSCFLFGIDDSLDNIFSQVKNMSLISKWAGGIGVHITGVRAKGSIIRGTNGTSDGIIPLCVVLNKVSRYVNQGGKRPGSIAVYMEPYHPDIFDFCELRKTNSGNDDTRARDLFLALWIPDLFMKRVENDGVWSLMCPDECPGLCTSHGKDFETLYEKYEQNKQYKKQVSARALWTHILECQIETGFPYMLYKDNVNGKSNQKNIGTIRSSNLCAEICEYSDGDATAVCNLASLCLPRYIVKNEDGFVYFDYEKLLSVVKVAIRNLNKVIDINFYPINSTKISNNMHRPIGLGVQGLADVYNMFSYDYESEEASLLNKKIFETIYFGAVSESNELAKQLGHYSTFQNSPFSQGKLQFHLWGLTEDNLVTKNIYDWSSLTESVRKYGTRNSLLTALMPTAGTSQIMKCYESFEPYMSNVFVRTTMAGEFIVINENLIRDLIKENLWSEDMRKLIIINKGSIQNIENIPNKLKGIYKTAFEIKLKSIISQSADRGPFIDQSQSMNLFMNSPDPDILTSAHFYGWKRGIKTGMYYLRTVPAVEPIQFGIDITDIIRLTGKKNAIELMFNYDSPNKTNMDNINNIDSTANIFDNNTNDSTIEEETNETPPMMCKYIPGKNAEGCLMCSG